MSRLVSTATIGVCLLVTGTTGASLRAATEPAEATAEHGWARTRKRLADYGARHAFEAEDGEGDERAVRFRATFGSVPGYQEGDPLRPTALQGGASAVVRLVREYGEWRVAGLSHPSVLAAAAAAA